MNMRAADFGRILVSLSGAVLLSACAGGVHNAALVPGASVGGGVVFESGAIAVLVPTPVQRHGGQDPYASDVTLDPEFSGSALRELTIGSAVIGAPPKAALATLDECDH